MEYNKEKSWFGGILGVGTLFIIIALACSPLDLVRARYNKSHGY